jgi:uncharacterized membrane protein
MRAASIFITVFTITLLIFTARKFGHLGWKEIQSAEDRQRGDFALALTTICTGMAGFMSLPLVYGISSGISPVTVQYWTIVELPRILLASLISAGLLLAIRAITYDDHGERMWVRRAAMAFIVAAAFAAMFTIEL